MPKLWIVITPALSWRFETVANPTLECLYERCHRQLDDKLETGLKELADRMVDTAVAHPQQFYNEVRVTATELDQALAVFRSFIR